MDYVEDKYIRFLSTRLDKFKHVKSGLYNFRCPYCGDSQKHRNKARGYFFLKKTEYIYKCHNCGTGRSLSNFLKDNATDLHDQFIMEKYRQGMTGKGRHTPSPTYKSAKPHFANKVTNLTSIAELNNSHPAKKYLLDRKIPESQLGKFFYVVNSRGGSIHNVQHSITFRMIDLELLSLSLTRTVTGLAFRVDLWHQLVRYDTSQ